VARTRTTKKLAQRVDLNYFKRPTAFKRAKLWLSVLVPLLAIVWIAWRGVARDSRVYSSGRMSAAHAVLERQCVACHVEKAGEFSSKAADSACLACHDGPLHHENQPATAVPTCAACHAEHRGRINLRAAGDQSCAQCHGDLKAADGKVHYAAHIRSLEDGHPEFVALREGAKDAANIRLNHAVHMRPIRQGPNGPNVQLECTDCHRNYQAAWKYAASQNPEMPSYQLHRDLPMDSLPRALPTLAWRLPNTGHERMRPVEFARACSGCHLLTFDKRFDEGVPHDKPQVVHAFLVQKFQEYIATHPSEVRVVRDPKRDLTGKPIPPEVRVLTTAQWIAQRTAEAELLLWRKTCKQCHALSGFVTMEDPVAARWAGPTPNTAIFTSTWITITSDGSRRITPPLPEIAPAGIQERWLPHAKFDHEAHRGFSCVSCHAKALTSTERNDILVPGIANCKTCHAPGPDHAESQCFECHTYHDWSKRKEVKANFTLPALQAGGR
jgi:hypothetical protein